MNVPPRFFPCAAGLLVLAISPAAAQDTASTWDVTLARGDTREIDFTTEEGTWMSVDISPDGRWIVFDLLAHIYRVPAGGGTAEVLTQESGVALNYHPQFSPDGRSIAFISDRGGQNNLWVMDADGSNPRQIFNNLNARATAPKWRPDGDYIIVRRQSVGGGNGRGDGGLFMYHRAGGEGVKLGDDEMNSATWPSVSSDGQFVYFQERTPGQMVSWAVEGGLIEDALVRDVLQGSFNISRYAIETGQHLAELRNAVTSHGGTTAAAGSSQAAASASAARASAVRGRLTAPSATGP